MRFVRALLASLDVQHDAWEPLCRSDLAAPSRCDGWTVGDVVEHSIGVTTKFAAFAAGATDSPRSRRVRLDPEAPLAIVDDARRAARAAWPTIDMSRQCTLPFGVFNADAAAGINLFDVLAHTWDVTDALRLELPASDELWSSALDAAEAVLRLDRDHAHYEKPIPAKWDAPIKLRFLSFLGRS